jgi:hypothetical protein
LGLVAGLADLQFLQRADGVVLAHLDYVAEHKQAEEPADDDVEVVDRVRRRPQLSPRAKGEIAEAVKHFRALNDAAIIVQLARHGERMAARPGRG